MEKYNLKRNTLKASRHKSGRNSQKWKNWGKISMKVSSFTCRSIESWSHSILKFFSQELPWVPIWIVDTWNPIQFQWLTELLCCRRLQKYIWCCLRVQLSLLSYSNIIQNSLPILSQCILYARELTQAHSWSDVSYRGFDHEASRQTFQM